jgi:hypothetical protein
VSRGLKSGQATQRKRPKLWWAWGVEIHDNEVASQSCKMECGTLGKRAGPPGPRREVNHHIKAMHVQSRECPHPIICSSACVQPMSVVHCCWQSSLPVSYCPHSCMINWACRPESVRRSMSLRALAAFVSARVALRPRGWPNLLLLLAPVLCFTCRLLLSLSPSSTTPVHPPCLHSSNSPLR